MDEEFIITEEEQRDPFSGGEDMSTPMVVLGLINGTIGSVLLILPVVAITAGLFTSIWVCLVIGFVTYYTADLIVIHLGRGKNIQESILAHFDYNRKYLKAYSFVIWLSLIPFIVGYFRLICLQV